MGGRRPDHSIFWQVLDARSCSGPFWALIWEPGPVPRPSGFRTPPPGNGAAPARRNWDRLILTGTPGIAQALECIRTGSLVVGSRSGDRGVRRSVVFAVRLGIERWGSRRHGRFQTLMIKGP